MFGGSAVANPMRAALELPRVLSWGPLQISCQRDLKRHLLVMSRIVSVVNPCRTWPRIPTGCRDGPLAPNIECTVRRQPFLHSVCDGLSARGHTVRIGAQVDLFEIEIVGVLGQFG